MVPYAGIHVTDGEHALDMTRKILCCLIVLSLLMIAGCKQEKPKPVLHEQKQAQEPVSLPEVPSFNSILGQVRPDKNGIYTTWAAIFNKDKLLNTEIRVKGTIVEVSEDCPEITVPKVIQKKKGAVAEEQDDKKQNKCPAGLSVTINSPDDVSYPLLITNYHPFYHPWLKPGMTMDVTGKYVLFGNSFIDSRNGLLIISEIHNMGVDKSGKFTTKQSEIQEMRLNDTLLVTRYKKHETKEAEGKDAENGQ